MNRRNVFENLVAFGLVASTLLAPLRLGVFEIVRPTLLIMLPCALYLVLTRKNLLRTLIYTPKGICAFFLCLLLTAGHLLGNDILRGSDDSEAALNLAGVWTILLVFITSMELADPRYRPGVFLGLGFGLAVHIVGVAIIPPSIHYRDFGRSSGFLHDPNILNIHLVPIFFLWVALLRRGLWLCLAPIALVPVAWATLQTLSRAGLGSLVCGVLICIAGLVYTARQSILRPRILGLTSLALAAAASFYFLNQSFFEERLEGHVTRALEISEGQGSHIQDRLHWWQDMQRVDALDLFTPLGIGYEKLLSTEILPHNTYADAFIIAGPIALLAFLALVLGTLRNAVTAAWRCEHAWLSPLYDSAILAAFVSHILILNTLSVVGGKINWLILGLVAGLLSSQFGEQPEEAPQDLDEEAGSVPAESDPVEA